jgi:energy-coupling factor transport system permease protein
MMYRRRASPLHAARAGAGAAWCRALGGTAISYENPIVLAALLAAALAAAAIARVWRTVARIALWGVPFALAIALVNALVDRDGATLLLTSDPLPVIGPLDITLEALAYGGVLGLRAVVVLLAAGGLLATTVDPDELLRALRRVSVRSGVTAALATRLMPVLARDARRLADARRAVRGGPPTGAERVAVLRAVTAGALDRATDVAATLEVRGFASARRPPRLHRPWSRHDVAFATSAAGMCVLAIAAAVDGWAPFVASPRLELPDPVQALVLGAGLLACALAPFLDRRGIEPA